MIIDPEKLEEAIKLYEGEYYGSHFTALREAARAYLATIPRYKEVGRECFEVVDQVGGCHGFYTLYSAAESIAHLGPCRTVVRLTGTAKVKVTP